MAKPKSASSNRWMKEHFNDIYVKQAQKEGFRGRAAYKLIELHKKDKLFNKGMCIVDLGAAPGGWSQVAKGLVGEQGKVFAFDILAMDPIPGVSFIKGDFTEDSSYQELINIIDGTPINWVISDMAPNMSGNKATDQAKSMYLIELAVEFAEHSLNQGGSFLAKVFQGKDFDILVSHLRNKYEKVVIRKPDASRARSKEVYVIAFNKK